MIAKLFVILLVNFLLCASVAFAQTSKHLHCVAPGTPDGLREILRFSGHELPLLSAHRGGAVAGYPENCLETFEHTISHTFSMLEIDLRTTRDGILVLLHDETLDRTTTGTGPVSNLTLLQLQQLRLKDNEGNVTEFQIPTLDSAIQWARDKTILILDKKQVSVQQCVEKIREHYAQSYVMVMASNQQDINTCYELDPSIMMEAMLGNDERVRDFRSSGVPWSQIVAFVGHEPPANKELLSQLHAEGVSCMAGTSRNLDRDLQKQADADLDEFRSQYRERLSFGIDLIETDLPVQVGELLFNSPTIPSHVAKYFHLSESRATDPD